MKFQVLTFGETMLRFTPPNNLRVEQASSTEMHVGGSESNTAVGLARLGVRTAWFSKLTDNPLGHHIANSIRAHGVDTSSVIWTNGDRVGLYFMERGCEGRPSQVFYDRAGSAIANMTADEIPATLIQDFAPDVFHTIGITLGLSSAARETTLRMISLAKSAKCLVSFDVNYRQKLWEPEQASASCQIAMLESDLIFLPIRDAQCLFALNSNSAEDALAQLHDQFPNATIVLTLGPDGTCAIEPTGKTYYVACLPCDPIERLGGGDAFSAGFLASYIVDRNTPQALRVAAAAAAIKYTIPGDLPLFDRAEVFKRAQTTVANSNIIR